MGRYLIKVGRLFDGVNDGLANNQFVAVENGMIASMGGQSELGADLGRFGELIELGDEATLLPGLINMHTHMSFSGGASVLHDQLHDSTEMLMIRTTENLRLSLATGVTTLRDCGTRNHIALAARQAVEDGLLPGPRIIASGNGITTTGGHCWYCGTEADGETEIRQAVRAQVKAGLDFIKLFSTGGNLTPGTNSLEAQYTEAELCAATEEARRLGRRTASHAHGTPGVLNSIAARVTTIEHCSFQTVNGLEYQESIAAQVAELGIYVCPTVFNGLTKLEGQLDFEPTAQQAFALKLRQQRLESTKRLAEQGVKLVSGNDAGVSHCNFGDYPDDLILTVEGCGLSPAYVLKSATSVAAEAMGRADFGAIRPGLRADLLGVRGNPLEAIATIKQRLLVMAEGKPVHRAA